MEARGWNSGTAVVFFHGGFVFDPRNIFHAKAGGNIEVTAQMGILLQPVLIVGFEEINPAVFEDEEGHCTVDLIVILERGNLVVLCQAAFELKEQIIIRLITNA